MWIDEVKVERSSLEVLTWADYYPYGLVMREGTCDSYRYQYQGETAEKDKETGWNHFELREYESVVGRWLSKDPKRQFWSSYLGMGNNPVSMIDPDGGEGTDWFKGSKSGSVFWSSSKAKTLNVGGEVYNNIGETYIHNSNGNIYKYLQDRLIGMNEIALAGVNTAGISMDAFGRFSKVIGLGTGLVGGLMDWTAYGREKMVKQGKFIDELGHTKNVPPSTTSKTGKLFKSFETYEGGTKSYKAVGRTLGYTGAAITLTGLGLKIADGTDNTSDLVDTTVSLGLIALSFTGVGTVGIIVIGVIYAGARFYWDKEMDNAINSSAGYNNSGNTGLMKRIFNR